jgi:hypothetical protein
LEKCEGKENETLTEMEENVTQDLCMWNVFNKGEKFLDRLRGYQLLQQNIGT